VPTVIVEPIDRAESERHEESADRDRLKVLKWTVDHRADDRDSGGGGRGHVADGADSQTPVRSALAKSL